MQNRRSVLRKIAAAVGAAPLLSACLSGPTYRYRYKLTISVSVDGVVHTGVNVVEVRWSLPAGPQMPNRLLGAAVKGEANVVELGGGRLLVALLTRRHDDLLPRGWNEADPTALLYRLYGISPGTTDAEQRLGIRPGLSELSRKRGAHTIGPDDLPELLTFADRLDPRTVAYVDQDNLQASFGANVHFERILLEVTGDPVTRTIQKRLPWLKDKKGHLDGSQFKHSTELANVISTASLQRD